MNKAIYRAADSPVDGITILDCNRTAVGSSKYGNDDGLLATLTGDTKGSPAS